MQEIRKNFQTEVKESHKSISSKNICNGNSNREMIVTPVLSCDGKGYIDYYVGNFLLPKN